MLDYALMISATGLGYAGWPWWSAVAIGCLLTLVSSPKQLDRVRRYADIGPARVMALGVGVTVANNIAFALMALALGRAAAWLLAQ